MVRFRVRLGIHLNARLRLVLFRFRLGIYFRIINMEIEPAYHMLDFSTSNDQLTNSLPGLMGVRLLNTILKTQL